jgi:cyclopropane fatty-acyl-phospholipid synthase-like methyltransferase
MGGWEPARFTGPVPAMTEPDRRLFSPSTARNRAPILAVLQEALPPDARVLEIASGSGEHAVFFARAMPQTVWQTSDPDSELRASIAAWIAHERLANVLPPLDLDVRRKEWGASASFDAIVAINMIHIAPWDATAALFAGARSLLRPDGIVFLYGPFMRGGNHTAPSNEAFDCWLRERDVASGVRDLDEVTRVAEREGFVLREIVEMPANNISVVFARA